MLLKKIYFKISLLSAFISHATIKREMCNITLTLVRKQKIQNYRNEKKKRAQHKQQQ